MALLLFFNMAVQITCQKKPNIFPYGPPVTDRILLAMIYAVTAESYYLLDHKNGANRNH